MTMSAKTKELAVILLVLIVALLIFPLINTKIAFSDETDGEIDIFTQKEPYSGKGLNVSSDAFAPGEVVILYALVTYNDYPVPSLLVAFEIRGPENPVENMTFSRAVFTNETGIAKMSFRISHLNETVFGEWMVIGNTEIGDFTFQDSLSFEVSWIVEIVSLETIDENYVHREKFMRGTQVGVELVLRSIAMTEQKVTLAIAVYSQLGVIINSTEINDFVVQPNGVLVRAYCFLYNSESSCVGEAVVRASVYTASVSLGGVPCCPEFSKGFLIIGHNVAILSVHPSPTWVYIGETVNIDVVVKNKGSEVEYFDVSVCYNETLIAVWSVLDLQPHSNVTISFTWNTSQVEEGFYRIRAYAEPVPGEIDTLDNVFTNGFVEVRAPVHDVAVLSVTPSSKITYVGETLDIDVVVRNEGGYVESFEVVVYYNYSYVVGTLFVDSLMPNDTKTLVFHWNTSDVSEGNYTLSALAEPVLGEEDTEDNYLQDGVVEVRVAPTHWFVPSWFWWLLPLLLLVLLLLIILLYYRKRRKKAEETFYAGWAAWYYCHDLRDKTHKT